MKPEEQRSGPGLPALSYHGFQVVPLRVPHEAVAHVHPAGGLQCCAVCSAATGAAASPAAALPLPACN